jgi:two-component system sensor histidine kinase/response regulator
VPAEELPAHIDGLPELPGIDRRAGMSVAMGKISLYRRLLQKFLATQSHFAEAFSIACESSDASAATRCAHTLKGNAANIGAKSVAILAGELEAACSRRMAADTIAALVTKVLAELEPVLAGLAVLDEPDAPADITTRVADPEQLERLIQLLTEQLADADAEAVETVQQLQELTAGTALAPAVRALSHTVFEFDFEQAEGALRRLKKM